MGCYRDAAASGQPIYAVHHSDRAATVFSWERLMLPLRDAVGCTWLLVHNMPLEDRHTLLKKCSMPALTPCWPRARYAMTTASSEAGRS